MGWDEVNGRIKGGEGKVRKGKGGEVGKEEGGGEEEWEDESMVGDGDGDDGGKVSYVSAGSAIRTEAEEVSKPPDLDEDEIL